MTIFRKKQLIFFSRFRQLNTILEKFQNIEEWRKTSVEKHVEKQQQPDNVVIAGDIVKLV